MTTKKVISSTKVTFRIPRESSQSSLAVDDLAAMEEGATMDTSLNSSKRLVMDASQNSQNSSFHTSAHLRMSRKGLDVDEDILHRAAADAGLGSMGTVYVEVWTFDGTNLVRPDGGYWMDPVFHNPFAEECGCCGTANCSACRISDPDHPNFLPADPVAPGVGLAGVLWSESNNVEDRGGMLRESMRASTRYLGPPKRNVVWRDLRAMANNPHLPYDERLQAIVDCGLGWAAGVPFHVNHHKGIVIYVARSTVDHNLLQDHSNEQYLLSAADLIGSAWALREPRRLANQARKAKREAAIRRARLQIITLVRMGARFDQVCQKNSEEASIDNKKSKQPPINFKETPPIKILKSKTSHFLQGVKAVMNKCKGSNNKPPPPFSTEQAMFSFVGSFLCLLLLGSIGHALLKNHGRENLLIMPPFAALVTLQFALTQAPAAQPRNCLVGQGLSVSIAMFVSYLPFFPVFFRQALATAISIGVMARCGVTHPPAGASAFLFASGLFGIRHMLLLLLGNLVAIVVGAVVNNTSEKRQYPTYIAMGLNPADMVAYLKR